MLTLMTNCDHDALIIDSSKVLHSRTFIYLLPFRKSNYLLSFCTINHFVRVAVTFFSKWWTSYLERNPSLPFTADRLIIPFLPPLVYFLFLLFLSVHSGPRDRSIGLSGSQDPTCPSGLSQPATQSVGQSVFTSVSTRTKQWR